MPREIQFSADLNDQQLKERFEVKSLFWRFLIPARHDLSKRNKARHYS